MKVIEMLYNFFNGISAYFQKRMEDNKNTPIAIAESSQVPSEEEKPVAVVDEINLAKRTLKTKLYLIEQKMEVFKKDFPHEYKYFLDKIESLRKTYNSTLEEIRQQMTFEIDPELSSRMNVDILTLDREIQSFIESEVKFDILSKKLQRLIVKLSILYNVSIWTPNEKEKAVDQLLIALTRESEIVQEFKQCDYILRDNQLRERIVTLISYADYLNFKISLRNSSISPERMVEKLVLYAQFKDFDYIAAFKAFVEDELSDLRDLLPFIAEEQCQNAFEKKIAILLKEIAYASDIRVHLLDVSFWSRVFELEASLLQFLKGCNGVEKDFIKVKIIDRMNIEVKENEVLTSPKTIAHLALTSVFSTTRDDRIWILTKLLKNVSNQITYKEIYFLLQLFDAIGVIQNTPNDLSRHMEKYLVKYPYDSRTIMKKKKYVLNSSEEKRYINAFPLNLDDDLDEIIDILTSLNMDFQIKNGYVCINSFYFNGLENIFSNNVQPQTPVNPDTTN